MQTVNENKTRLCNRPTDLVLVLLAVVLCVSQTGCLLSREKAIRRFSSIANIGTQRPTVKIRPSRDDTNWNQVKNYFASRRQPSERTEILLRKYSVLDQYEENPESVIKWMEKLCQGRPKMDEVHALAEIAEIQADYLAQRGRQDSATNLYAVAVVHAYQFLFDEKLNIERNAYDPQFRSICDIYNRSLEGMLREACSNGNLRPGETTTVGDKENAIEFEVQIVGRWADQKFERFELVNDYQTEGIANQYHTYGLGVPLIAIRKQQESNEPAEKYYPPELTLPLTAFCHFQIAPNQLNSDGGVNKATLTLYDPLERTSITANSQVVPLESDITTPLAYHLRDPILNSGVLATAALLDAEFAPEYYGMYMLEPYDPDKIPVVMIHGFWSSPTTWARMFNDLRANREIHNNYQFWFYSYPTGQPFWISARQLREDLTSIHQSLDPRGDSQSLDQMILVGHSMGGLVSTMQTIDSGNEFWSMVSNEPVEEFTGDPDSLRRLKETFFFSPNDSVNRVITIATPFQGSSFANGATRWVSKKLFTLPSVQTNEFSKIADLNGVKLVSKFLLTTATSLDSLTGNAEIFTALENARASTGTKYHNIVGEVPRRTFLTSSAKDLHGDGVVSYESAKHHRAISEATVPAEHSDVHQHPSCIYEVRRILLENLIEMDRIRDRNIPDLPVVEQEPDNTVKTQSRPSQRLFRGRLSQPATANAETVQSEPGFTDGFSGPLQPMTGTSRRGNASDTNESPPDPDYWR